MADSEQKIPQDLVWKLVGVLLTLLLTGNTATVVWMLKTQVSLRERVATIEGNRFTSKDGLQVWREIATVQKELARLPTSSPPAWFVAQLQALGAKLEQIDQRLMRLEMRKGD